jgi:hypothetical protein
MNVYIYVRMYEKEYDELEERSMKYTISTEKKKKVKIIHDVLVLTFEYIYSYI